MSPPPAPASLATATGCRFAARGGRARGHLLLGLRRWKRCLGRNVALIVESVFVAVVVVTFFRCLPYLPRRPYLLSLSNLPDLPVLLFLFRVSRFPHGQARCLVGPPPFAPMLGIRRRNRRRHEPDPVEFQARILGFDRPAHFIGERLAANLDLRRRAKPEQHSRPRRLSPAPRARLDDGKVLVASPVARKLQKGHGVAIFVSVSRWVDWVWRVSQAAWLSRLPSLSRLAWPSRLS